MTRSRVVMLVALVAVLAAVGWSARPHTETQAERVDRITSELRCVVCQGLSVKDSPAESARQMRDIVVQRVSEGRTDGQIRDEFRASYGDWVVLAPPLVSFAGLVWLVPIVALVAGVALAWRWLRAPTAPLPEAPAAELAALRARVTREEALDLPDDAP
ncbi:MAG: cytochrome c-type biogenesis protein CcmH [Candidatus Limnocylindria bacterium]|nr:cytochrome c-type biogenesis protein CcmH [Candidatus Limnocylindria bacterium]